MDEKLLNHLSCPFCGGQVKIKKALRNKDSLLFYGLLTCDECNTHYPVVEGIPIMMSYEKKLDVYAQTIKEKSLFKNKISVLGICEALENDEIDKVKEAIVYSIPYTLYTLPKYANILGKFGKRAIRKIMRSSYFDHKWAKYVKSVLEDDNTTYREALKLYYQDHNHFNYFFYKFGQPRFLTTISLATTINTTGKPVLDIACGHGHLIYFLTQKNIGSMAVGVDRNFCQLVLAKKFIAPKGQFICAEADEKLPFRKDTFDGINCSDAFHGFQKKTSCIGDLKEILTNNGTIFLNRVGNQYVAPNEGIELSPEGYLKLFGSMPARMVGEDYLLNTYLKKKKPDLSQEEDITQFKDQKWLTVVASNDKQVFRDYGYFDEWPHRIGKLFLNPHYQKTGGDENGNEHYKFSYPSDWYEFENFLWGNYAPGEVTLSKNLLDSLNDDKTNPMIDKYIDEFVIMGFPENYM